MNVEIGTEAAQFPEKEYINGIFVAVWERVFNLRSYNLRPHPSMQTHNRDIEKSSDQATQFNI
jgi:hypothetical protein